MDKNRVEIGGVVSWDPPPYFDLVARQDHDPVPFLRFYVLVARDRQQQSNGYHDAYPSDSVRVVAYGALAERLYATLEPDAEVEVQGWLQSRKIRRGAVLEVIAREVVTTGQILPRRMLKRLRAIAARRGMELRELTSLLLEPQVAAVEAETDSDLQDQD